MKKKQLKDFLSHLSYLILTEDYIKTRGDALAFLRGYCEKQYPELAQLFYDISTLGKDL